MTRARLCVCLMLLVSLPALAPTKIEAASTEAFDLVVYGATASGTVTAVAAGREGLRVALIDPGHHVGGMLTGGLSATDVGKPEVIGGIAREFFERVGHYYHEPIEWRFEPHVADQVLDDMLREAKVTTFLGKRLREKTGVARRGNTIVAIELEDGAVLHAPLFVDATYEGDLMAEAGVSYTWGRESSIEYGESFAGVRGRQRPDHHFNVRVSPFATDGSLLPEVSPGPKGLLGQGDKKIPAFNFRVTLTNRHDNQVPYPRPDGYDPHRYELLKRLIEAMTRTHGHPPAMAEFLDLGPLKGGKFDANNQGAFSTDHVGANWDFPTADYERRSKMWRDHYRYEAGFLYFLAHDPSVPASLRNEVNQYGLAKDEFADTHNWPPQLYIREGRRMFGSYFMTQKDVQEDRKKADSIGMGSYEVDSHQVQRVPTADGAVEDEGEMYLEVHPYEIPYRIMLPKNDEVDNLLVAVCLSASHVAYSTLRIEPQYMIIGQAAGIAASLAIRHKVSLREISIPELQKRLLDEHAVLSLPQPSLSP